jgi:hypothetical protein
MRVLAVWEPLAADWKVPLSALAAEMVADLRALGRDAEADALAARAAAWGP